MKNRTIHKQRKFILRQMKKERIIFRKKMEELEAELYVLKLKQRKESAQRKNYEILYSTTNKQKRSEGLKIRTHRSIPTAISKIHGRKPINRQAARIVNFKFKK